MILTLIISMIFTAGIGVFAADTKEDNAVKGGST